MSAGTGADEALEEAVDTFVLEGPERPAPPDEPLGDVIFAALRSHAKQTDRSAQVDAATGATLSFHSLLEDSVRIAEGLRTKRLSPGHVVAVCSTAVADLYPAVLGAVWAGLTVMPTDPEASPSDLKAQLQACKPRAVFAEPRTLAKVHDALQGAPRQVPVIVLNQDDVPAKLVRAGDVAYEDLLRAVPTATADVFTPPVIARLDDHVPFILSGLGAAGREHAHYAMLSNKRAFVLLDQFREPLPDAPGVVFLSSRPLSCLAGVFSLLRCCWAGHTVVTLNDREPLSVLAALEKNSVSHWLAQPGAVRAVAEHASLPKFNLKALTAVLLDGDAMPADTHVRAQQALAVRLQAVYCVPEAGMLLFNRDAKPGSVGKVCPGARLKVVDSISEEDLEAGECGELRSKTSTSLKGYVGDPEATAALFDERGWFCTGDVMKYDEEGYFYFMEKLSENIQCAGTAIPAKELEDVIRTHPGVRDVAVLGRPDPDDGEVPMAFVVLEPSATATKHDIIQLVKDKLPESKQLRGGVEFLDALPRTTSGKLSGRQLRDRMPRRSVVGSLLM
ncbi:Luciferin 4-monooxygenase [Frankliniella fusca]|uniref:Luciferin 4-monooxygenase n=1 Tax=Frankliniella fusca TaxID=407009 RepID=A0AAE1HNX0_9NEOP|nr:Luciferin 4-monooxygenase [Frankliniella fusca]